MMRAMAFLGCVGLLVAGAMAEEPLTIRLTTDGVLLVTEADNGKETVAWVGKTVELRLEGDQPGTGWEADAASGPLEGPVLEFKPAPGAADKAVGTYIFRYKAVKEGAAAIRAVYVFPGGPQPVVRKATKLVREFKATVAVKAPAAGVPQGKETPAGGRVLPDNATAKFLGPEADWPKCKLVLRDVQGLFGGQDVYLDGSGDCILRAVDKGLKEKRFRLKLAAEESLALRRMCIRADLAYLEIKERPGVPDEAHPEISITSAAGETRKVAKWANDKVPAFDKVYALLAGMAKRTADLKPEFEGPYDPAWKPETK
ncbi:MAG: hypothetical protein NTX87_12095 [Planctomycetota bacterium]|nr:hypothetical protein [Planctomycetota bacterium]